VIPHAASIAGPIGNAGAPGSAGNASEHHSQRKEGNPMNDDKKIQQQIRALLALAQDEGASASEREVATKRASVLMARHAITSLDVEAAERERIEERELVLRGARAVLAGA